jgi:hypothetical protein
MAGRVGIGLGLGISAGALLVGGFNMESRYNDEMADDRANAAVAQAFLDNQGAVKADILALVSDVDGRISHFAETVGASCMAIIDDTVDDTGAKTIDDVVAKSDCELDDDQISEARGLLVDLQVERADLTRWTEPMSYGDGETRLEAVADAVQEVIDDASDSSRFGDLVDTSPIYEIGVEVQDGAVVTNDAVGNRYDASQALMFTATALGGVIVINSGLEKRKAAAKLGNTAP